MELKLYIQQAKTYNGVGQPIIFTGSSPATLTPVINGTLPPSRQWAQYGNYIDITTYASNLFKLKITWTSERDEFGNISVIAEQKKTATGTITIEDYAFRLIKKWLFDDVSAPLNAVDVRIEHVNCGTYQDFQIRATDITYCESDPNFCSFDVILKQKDDSLLCIQNTLIADNHQGWFEYGSSKFHPNFSYCNEQRPNGLLIMLWCAMSILFVIFTIIVVPIITLINIVIIIILGVVTVINTIISAINVIPGINIPLIPTQNLNPISYKDFFDSLAELYIESAGCGKGHTAPLVKDYISNVCTKCGVSVNANTAPIFFADTMQLNTSSQGLINKFNPHSRVCYFFPTIKKGIGRGDYVIGAPSGTAPTNDSTPNFAPVITLSELLDQLKTVYNAEWRVVNNTLYFQRKDYYISGAIIYDFSLGAVDRLKLLEGICFTWNQIKMPASAKGLYTDDAADKPGNEALDYMNDVISYTNDYNSPTLNGLEDLTTVFAGTGFRLMGTSPDYLYDAFQVTLNFTQILGPIFIPIRNAIRNMLVDVADYSILIQGDTVSKPKLIIWDGVDLIDAKVWKAYVTDPIPNFPMPPVNPNYNTQPWNVIHPSETKVKGQALTFPPFNQGFYTVTGLFGGFELKSRAYVINYPMYLGIGFQDTLWDWFWWINDPLKNPKANLTFVAKIELCCEDLKRLELFSTTPLLGNKVKVNAPYNTDGKITEIEVSYDTKTEVGGYIQIKGFV